jgi:hypothetical protein
MLWALGFLISKMIRIFSLLLYELWRRWNLIADVRVLCTIMIRTTDYYLLLSQSC